MYCDLPRNEEERAFWTDTQIEQRVKELMWTEWYEDTEGYLYITDAMSDEWVYGPDNEMADKIAEALNGGAGHWELHEIIEGLNHVDYVLRRFNEEDGFYHN